MNAHDLFHIHDGKTKDLKEVHIYKFINLFIVFQTLLSSFFQGLH